MGGATAAARVRPARPLRATSGPRRPAPRPARAPSVPGFQLARSPPAPRRGPARPTRFREVRWSADFRADGPRVMPENRCVSKNWKWWPGAESNHRHADFQYGGAALRVVVSRRPERGFSPADRTAPPDRAYPEPEARNPDPTPTSPIRFNGLGKSRPNFFRTGRRTGPRRGGQAEFGRKQT